MASNPLRGFQVDPSDLEFLGGGLARPECILASPNGDFLTCDLEGIACTHADGSVEKIRRIEPANAPAGKKSIPNGFAIDPEGRFVIANHGQQTLERMDRNGKTEILLSSLEGRPLGDVNFVLSDGGGGFWLTVSTRIQDWFAALNQGRLNDGYIVRIDAKGARIVADGLAFTNECRIDARGEYLYAAETFGLKISRFPLLANGDLGPKKTYGPDDLDGFPDGIAFDAHGNLWAALMGSDRIIAITPEGELLKILLLGKPDAFDAIRKALDERQLTAKIMMGNVNQIAPAVTSLAFGGSDLSTVYLGALWGKRIPFFRSPAAGLPMAHWPR